MGALKDDANTQFRCSICTHYRQWRSQDFPKRGNFHGGQATLYQKLKTHGAHYFFGKDLKFRNKKKVNKKLKISDLGGASQT